MTSEAPAGHYGCRPLFPTSTACSKALDKAQSFVSKAETAERRVDPVELRDFANLYKKPLAWFVEGD